MHQIQINEISIIAKNVIISLKDGSTLMHIAAGAGHPATAMVFMKRGVALHMPNKVKAF